jgi:hypothetical protein
MLTEDEFHQYVADDGFQNLGDLTAGEILIIRTALGIILKKKLVSYGEDEILVDHLDEVLSYLEDPAA